MPQDSEKLPRTLARTTTAVNSLVLKSRRLAGMLAGSMRSATTRPDAILRRAFLRSLQGRRLLFLDELFALGADRQVFPRLFIEPREIVILDGLLHHAPGSF